MAEDVFFLFFLRQFREVSCALCAVSVIVDMSKSHCLSVKWFHLALLQTDRHLCWPLEYRNIRWKLLSECRQTTSPYHHNKLAKAPGEKMSSFVLSQRCCSALTDCELRFCWLQLCLCTRQPFLKNKIMHHFLEPLCYRHDNTSHHGPLTQPTPLPVVTLTTFPHCPALVAVEWLHELLWRGAGEAAVSAGAGRGQEERHQPTPQRPEEWWVSQSEWWLLWATCLKYGCMVYHHSSLHSKSCLHCSGLLPEDRSQAASHSEKKANPHGECHALFLISKSLIANHVSWL